MMNKFDLHKAIHLNRYLRLYPKQETVKRIVRLTGLKENLHNVSIALSCILANLYNSSVPIMISLDNHFWTKLKKTGVEWSSYNTVSKILKTLLDLKYIDRVAGYYDRSGGEGKEKRYRGKYWMLGDTTLTEELLGCETVLLTPTDRLVELRDKDGWQMKYSLTRRDVKEMKNSLRRYNKSISNTTITYGFQLLDLFNDNPNQFHKRMQRLMFYINTGQIKLFIGDDQIHRMTTPVTDEYWNNSTDRYSNKTDNIVIQDSNNNIQNTGSIVIHDTVYIVYTQVLTNSDTILNNTIQLKLPDQSLFFTGEILNKSLFRVFNRGSLDFDFGGRFYGAVYQSLSKVVRKSFSIDGEKVVNLDYSGMHIRMLYHDMEQEFQGECYPNTNKTERTQFKLAAMIVINAKDRREASGAIFERLMDKGISLTPSQIKSLMLRFEEFHKPIKKYFYNDIGVVLQNKDSTIMNNILSILYDKGIIALPIHDEIICQHRYKDFVLETMSNEYENIMNFKPVID